jgi:hypothetical protein
VSFLDWFRDRPVELPQEHAVPKGGSGRGHSNGFLELEEFNPELLHPFSHDVFDKMYRTDADGGQIIDLLVNPIAGGTWGVEAYGGTDATDEDKRIAEDLEWALFEAMEPTWTGLLAEFLPVLFRSGISPGEILWRATQRDGRDLLIPSEVQLRLPRSINRFLQQDGRLTGIEQFLVGWRTDSAGENPEGYGQRPGSSSGSQGGLVTIDRRDLLYFMIGKEGDNWEGVSLLRRAYKHWYIKDTVERMDAVAQEREALGIPILYPPPGADEATLTLMDQAMGAMRAGETSFIRMPGMKAGAGAPDGAGWLLELMGFDRTGSGRDPQPLLDYHSNKIAAAVIADFMKLGHGSTGARSTAVVQADPFLKSIEKLTGIVEHEARRQLVLPFVARNYSGAKNLPKITMSLVDQTSLTQLADFVLKLVQVGALMPDQDLEDFLRRRADLPAASSEAVKDRGKKDGELRRTVVGAVETPPPGLDPFGSNAGVGQHKNGKPAGAGLKRGGAAPKSGAPKGPAGAGKGAPRGPAKNLWVDPDDLKPYILSADSSWWERPADGLELNVDLAHLDEEMSLSGHLLEHDLQDSVLSIARGETANMVDLTKMVHARLCERYATGADFVCDELGIDDPRSLSASMDDGPSALHRRAEMAARSIDHAVRIGRDTAGLGHGADSVQAQAAGEEAGRYEARRQGLVHGIASIQHGRHDQILAAGDRSIGVRYSAVLDRGTCQHCEQADDGVVRSFDDPVRMDRRPPNRHCDSVGSGHNRCRCVEVPVPMGPEGEQSLEDHVAGLVARRGMDVDRATAVATAHRAHWERA